MSTTVRKSGIEPPKSSLHGTLLRKMLFKGGYPNIPSSTMTCPNIPLDSMNFHVVGWRRGSIRWLAC